MRLCVMPANISTGPEFPEVQRSTFRIARRLLAQISLPRVHPGYLMVPIVNHLFVRSTISGTCYRKHIDGFY